MAKHENGKYHHGHVHQISSQNFFKVNFKDNSWSDNLYQQDILVGVLSFSVSIFLRGAFSVGQFRLKKKLNFSRITTGKVGSSPKSVARCTCVGRTGKLTKPSIGAIPCSKLSR